MIDTPNRNLKKTDDDLRALFERFDIETHLILGHVLQKEMKKSLTFPDGLLNLIIAYTTLRLLMKGSATVQFIRDLDQLHGVSKHRLWKYYHRTIQSLGWRIVERCENTCLNCQSTWQSVVLCLSGDSFAPICPQCGHHAITIKNIGSMPQWVSITALFDCPKCKIVSPRFLIEFDPFHQDIVRAICPKCLAPSRYSIVSEEIQSILHATMRSKLNSVLYEVSRFFDLPDKIATLARRLLEGINIMDAPLYTVFATIEIAKTVLRYKDHTDYQLYLRKRFFWGRSKKVGKVMKNVLRDQGMKIVEGAVATCRVCNHTNTFLKEGNVIRCPSCSQALTFDPKFISFSEIDLPL